MERKEGEDGENTFSFSNDSNFDIWVFLYSEVIQGLRKEQLINRSLKIKR